MAKLSQLYDQIKTETVEDTDVIAAVRDIENSDEDVAFTLDKLPGFGNTPGSFTQTDIQGNDSLIQSRPLGRQSGWSSEEEIDLFQVELVCSGVGNSSASSLLLHLNYSARDGSGAQSSSSRTYIINLVAQRRFSGSFSSGSTGSTVTKLGDESNIDGATLLSTLDPTVSVATDAETSKATFTIKVTPTSGGETANNALGYSVINLASGGLAGLAGTIVDES